jgi:hypothetical protein
LLAGRRISCVAIWRCFNKVSGKLVVGILV